MLNISNVWKYIFFFVDNDVLLSILRCLNFILQNYSFYNLHLLNTRQPHWVL